MPVEVLNPDLRDSRRALVVGALLLAALIGAGSLVAMQPPPPLRIRLERVEGSALAEDSFVRLQVGIRATDADELRLGEVRLRLAGAQGLGAHEARFDARGRAVVQVDLTPGCREVAGTPDGLANGSLDLEVRDGSGATRRLSLPVVPEGQLERLVRYRCA